ncbi:MAG: MOSC domain-containing protein [Streptosporangiales bacterium]|nr:MOSC domain-containing protein [Streptosporangiales bacterium]
MRVTYLGIHPLKSTRSIAVESAVVEPWGLAGDRRWAVVDADGGKVTAREESALLRVTAAPEAGGALTLTAPDTPPLTVKPPESGERVPVGFRNLDHALAAGDDADAWLTRQIGRPVRLVWLDDPYRRAVDGAHGGLPGEAVTLADATPLLLTATASLDRLNEWVAETAAGRGESAPDPLVMRRFRPNVVVDGETPFAEDDWTGLRIGEVDFRVASLCDRCVMTTIEPDTLARGKEPLRTLAKRRRWDGKTWFGVRLVPRTTGEIRVGDSARSG